MACSTIKLYVMWHISSKYDCGFILLFHFQPLLTMRVDEQDIKKLSDEQYIQLRNDYTGNKQVSLSKLKSHSSLYIVFTEEKHV